MFIKGFNLVIKTYTILISTKMSPSNFYYICKIPSLNSEQPHHYKGIRKLPQALLKIVHEQAS